jgi:hypothetical protein
MIEIGVLKTWNSTAYTASVQLTSSPATFFADIAVARNIASAQMVIGRHVIVALPGTSPKDAVVIAVFTP